MCGIVGIYGEDQAASIATLALFRLQHRGQATAGLVTCDGANFFSRRDNGLVGDVLPPSACRDLKGSMAVGHVRYPTSGSKEREYILRNAGPLMADLPGGTIAIAHNGNIVGTEAIRDQMLHEQRIFMTETDTEILTHMIATSRGKTFLDRLTDSLRKLPISYSLLILTKQGLYAVRDPQGVRPLVFGRRDNGSYVFASETLALDIAGARYERDVEPGEIISVDEHGLRSFRFAESDPRPCIFEYVYFANPASENGMMHFARLESGKLLAKNHPAPADIVIGVPDSGLSAAQGYAEALGKPLVPGIVRSHYSGRSFIESSHDSRVSVARFKHIINKKLVAGQRIALIDDSIVRGNTLPQIIHLLREAGAREVHIRISSPAVISPCHYGIDTPTHEELLAYRYPSEDAMATHLRADSLEFLSRAELIQAVGAATGKKTFCTSCFDGLYLTDAENDDSESQPAQFSAVA